MKKAGVYLCRFFRALLMPIRRNMLFFAFMSALGMMCIVLGKNPDPRHIREPNPIIELFADLYLLCTLLLAVPGKARSWVRGVLALLLYATAIVDIWCWTTFQSHISPTMLLLVAETTGREAGEFAGSYITADVLFSKTGWIILLMLLHAPVAIFHLPLRRKTTALLRQLPHTLELQSLLGLTAVAALTFGLISSWENKQKVYRIMSHSTIGGVERELIRNSSDDIMYLPVYRLAYSFKSNYLISLQLHDLHHAQRNATVDSCEYTTPHVVLIIGESYNKHHSALFGYQKPTTPHQLHHQRRRMLVPYSDVVAPWNLTSFVFKLMFSTYTVKKDESNDDWCNHPLFPSLFRRAGFKVDFLTNQFLPRSKEAIYDFSGGFFLNDEELSRGMFDYRNTQLHTYDEALLADYDSISASRENDTVPRLTIFHLMGQHVEYNQRFPKDRTHFTAADYVRPDLKKKEVQWIADYDNATLYNDSILDQIIRRFEKQNAVIIYLADHGEEVYDGIRNKHGRVHSYNISPRLAHEEYEIPMWFYCTEPFIRTHPELFRRIRSQRDKPFMTDALPHLLLYLAGIHTSHYDERCNILSPSYNQQRARLMKRHADYNLLDMSKYHK